MGQRPFKELNRSKQLAVLFRDTQRLRHLVEKDLNDKISDEEWLRVLPSIVSDTVKRIRIRRRPAWQRQFEELAANGLPK